MSKVKFTDVVGFSAGHNTRGTTLSDELRDEWVIFQQELDALEEEERSQYTGALWSLVVSENPEDHAKFANLIRRKELEIVGLADSIAAVGLINPVTVRKIGNRVYVTAGTRRLLALAYTAILSGAGAETFDANVQEGNEDDATLVGLAENIQRKNVTAMSEAIEFLRLQKAGLKVNDIAKRYGTNYAYVNQRIKLNNLSNGDRRRLERGTLKLQDAIGIATGKQEEGTGTAKAAKRIRVRKLTEVQERYDSLADLELTPTQTEAVKSILAWVMGTTSNQADKFSASRLKQAAEREANPPKRGRKPGKKKARPVAA